MDVTSCMPNKRFDTTLSDFPLKSRAPLLPFFFVDYDDGQCLKIIGERQEALLCKWNYILNLHFQCL